MNQEDAKEENKENSALCPQSWPFDLDLLPVPAFLVGGAVRDALLGRRREYLDLDFVLAKGAVETARTIATYYKAGFVLLDRERQIARVVFKNATADFAQQEGDTLEKDLQRRDFTVNAIAYNPLTQEIIDPLQGIADLQAGVMRMVSPVNLEDDPLRLLRAYRQAAQLGFSIEPQTRSVIRQLAPLLANMAAERVRVELGYLLTDSAGNSWLSAAWEDGILRWVLHDNVTKTNVALLDKIDGSCAMMTERWPQLLAEISRTIPGLAADAKRTWLAIAKLVTLLITENFFSGVQGLEVRLNYNRSGILTQNSTVEDFLKRITFSVPEIRAVNTILKILPQMRSPSMSVREEYFFFREVGVVFPTLAVVAVASGTQVQAIAPLLDRYFNPNDQVAHPTPLVTGNDLIEALHLPPSPKIGQLLTEIQIARIEGKIFTATEAIKLASQLPITS